MLIVCHVGTWKIVSHLKLNAGRTDLLRFGLVLRIVELLVLGRAARVRRMKAHDGLELFGFIVVLVESTPA